MPDIKLSGPSFTALNEAERRFVEMVVDQGLAPARAKIESGIPSKSSGTALVKKPHIEAAIAERRHRYEHLFDVSVDEKFDAILADVKQCMEKGAPVLVGTASVGTSESMSARFRKAKVEHKVLNAKYHEQEAEIVAQAGRLKSVTIATNMAGRGTDILLGGNPEALTRDVFKNKGLPPDQVDPKQWRDQLERLQTQVAAEHDEVGGLGGLHILGTERHEARRIDNQLRGRAGRQGDPGSSRFYLSLEDDLMRIFAGPWVKAFLERLGMQEGERIESPMVTRRIEGAQKKVEERNFEMGDYLVVAVNSDRSVKAIKAKERPIVPEQERAEMVAALEFVDGVVIFDDDTPLRVIEHLLPDVLVKGGDWQQDRIVGSDVVKKAGGEVKSIPFVPG